MEEITGAVLLVLHGSPALDTGLITDMVVMGYSGQGTPSHLWDL